MYSAVRSSNESISDALMEGFASARLIYLAASVILPPPEML